MIKVEVVPEDEIRRCFHCGWESEEGEEIHNDLKLNLFFCSLDCAMYHYWRRHLKYKSDINK